MKNGQDSLFHNDYTKHLESINGIKFTPREMDIISCLLSGRTPKVIASFLSVSPRTIETHIRNIMLKVECNSREGIINFIEKTDKGSLIKKHYLNLLSDYSFKQKLKEISKLSKGSSPSVLLLAEKELDQTFLMQQIESHLSIAGVNVEVISRKDKQDTLEPGLENEPDSLIQMLYIAPITDISYLSQVQDQDLLSLVEQAKHNPSFIIFLSRKPSADISKNNNIEGIELINSKGQQNYYMGIFETLKKMMPSNKLDEITNAFKDDYKNSHSPYTGLLKYVGKNPQENELKKYSLFGSFLSKALIVAGGSLGVALAIITFMFWGERIELVNSSKTIRSDFFIPSESTLLDREHVLSQIEEKLNSKKGIRTLALIGIAGAGKTTLARRYARNQQNSVVWEINAESKESLIQSFESLAHSLSKEEQEKRELQDILAIKILSTREERLLSFVKDKLRKQDDWLLVYNDLDDLIRSQDYIPRDENTWGRGRVLITTADSNIESNNFVDAAILIGELSPDDKLSLFMRIMNNEEEIKKSKDLSEQIKAFLNNLPPFPLDISIAAYYLKVTQISYDKYLEYLYAYDEEFTAVQEEILKGANNSETRYKIIVLSIKELIESNKDFTELLLFTSLLTSQGIPRALLEMHKSEVVVDNFIYNLRKYSLLTKTESKDTYSFPTLSIHKSTQGISLAYLSKFLRLEENNVALQSLVNTLEAYEAKIITEEDFAKMKILALNCKAFLKHGVLKEDKFQGPIKARLGVIYFNLGDYLESKKMLDESLEILNRLDKNLPENRFRISNVLIHLGMVHRKLGNYVKARDLVEEGLKGYRTHNPQKYAEISQSLRYLGMVHNSLGDYEKAQALFEESLSFYTTHLSKKQPGYVWSLGSLGVIYRKLGNYGKAEELLTKSLEIYRKDFPDNHAGLAWTLTHLGRVCIYSGHYEKAKELLEQSLHIYKTHLSENNLKIFRVLGPLGVACRELEDYHKAEKFLLQTLENYRKQLPENHISISWAAFHLGIVYKCVGNYEKARELLTASLANYEKHYGQGHLETARLLMELGRVSFIEGKLEEAENLIHQSLNVYSNNNHSRTYVALECLADLYIKRFFQATKVTDKEEYNRKANDYLKRSLEIAENHFPADSPHIKRIKSKMEKLL